MTTPKVKHRRQSSPAMREARELLGYYLLVRNCWAVGAVPPPEEIQATNNIIRGLARHYAELGLAATGSQLAPDEVAKLILDLAEQAFWDAMQRDLVSYAKKQLGLTK